MKDIVKVVFEMPREEFATLKYLCIKKNVKIKDILGKAANEITKQFVDEEFQKQEEKTHEFPQLTST